MNVELAPKKLELMHELLPAVNSMALLVNPSNPTAALNETRAVQDAARTIPLDVKVLHASTESDFDSKIGRAHV